jgi:hypothetical protein
MDECPKLSKQMAQLNTAENHNKYLNYFDLKDQFGKPGRPLTRPLKLYDYIPLFFNQKLKLLYVTSYCKKHKIGRPNL